MTFVKNQDMTPYAPDGAGTGGADALQKQTGHVFLAQSPEAFGYDLDGNLISDGHWTYTWDAENRLASMQTQPAAASAGAPNLLLQFAYDAQGRRIQKKVSNWNGTAFVLSSDTRFLYDGWNLMAEFSVQGSTFSVQRSYVWGLDLSGTMQGAGGVGGLLVISNMGGVPSPGTYAPAYDGNGNIINLTSAADGSDAADFEYDPFGNVLKSTGPAANAQPFGFSTKYQDAETGLVNYGHRYLNTSTGRFLSKDPLEEAGGKNLYGFVANDAVNRWDYLGLDGSRVYFFLPNVTLKQRLDIIMNDLNKDLNSINDRWNIQKLCCQDLKARLDIANHAIDSMKIQIQQFYAATSNNEPSDWGPFGEGLQHATGAAGLLTGASQAAYDLSKATQPGFLEPLSEGADGAAVLVGGMHALSGYHAIIANGDLDMGVYYGVSAAGDFASIGISKAGPFGQLAAVAYGLGAENIDLQLQLALDDVDTEYLNRAYRLNKKDVSMLSEAEAYKKAVEDRMAGLGCKK